MEKLKTYLKKTKMTQAMFAEKAGITNAYASQLVSGARTPSLAMARKISTITNGAVPMSSWGGIS